MIRSSIIRMALCSLILASALAISRPAAAHTPHHCWTKHGGNGGASYFTNWRTELLMRMVVWHGNVGFGNVINGIEWTWCGRDRSGNTYCDSQLVGRRLGTLGEFLINWMGGERLDLIQGRSGKYLDSIQVRTNWGRMSPLFGSQAPLSFSQGFGSLIVNDFWGTSGHVVDSLGACTSTP